MVSKLQGVDARGIPVHKDLRVRAGPLAAQSKVGNVKLLRGSWNDMFLRQMHNFGGEAWRAGKVHDDMVSAASGAFMALADNLGGMGMMF